MHILMFITTIYIYIYMSHRFGDQSRIVLQKIFTFCVKIIGPTT